MENYREITQKQKEKILKECPSVKFGYIIGDYKTSSKQVKKIHDYTNQLNIYAYLLSISGKKVHTLRVVNINPRTKTLAPRVGVLECPADEKKGEELVNLMWKKSKMAYDNPEYKDYIFNPNTYSFLDTKEKIETDFKEL